LAVKPALAYPARLSRAKHALNAYDMLFDPQSLIDRAGGGVRQGFADVGSVEAAA